MGRLASFTAQDCTPPATIGDLFVMCSQETGDVYGGRTRGPPLRPEGVGAWTDRGDSGSPAALQAWCGRDVSCLRPDGGDVWSGGDSPAALWAWSAGEIHLAHGRMAVMQGNPTGGRGVRSCGLTVVARSGSSGTALPCFVRRCRAFTYNTRTDRLRIAAHPSLRGEPMVLHRSAEITEGVFFYLWVGQGINSSSVVLANALDRPEAHMLVDPGMTYGAMGERPLDSLVQAMSADGLRLEDVGLVFGTHSHPDHFQAVDDVVRRTGAGVALSVPEHEFLTGVEIRSMVLSVRCLPPSRLSCCRRGRSTRSTATDAGWRYSSRPGIPPDAPASICRSRSTGER